MNGTGKERKGSEGIARIRCCDKVRGNVYTLLSLEPVSIKVVTVSRHAKPSLSPKPSMFKMQFQQRHLSFGGSKEQDDQMLS